MRLRAVASAAADSLCECSEQAACERHSELSDRMFRYIQFQWTRVTRCRCYCCCCCNCYSLTSSPRDLGWTSPGWYHPPLTNFPATNLVLTLQAGAVCYRRENLLGRAPRFVTLPQSVMSSDHCLPYIRGLKTCCITSSCPGIDTTLGFKIV